MQVESAKKQPRMWLWIGLAVAGLILVQALGGKAETRRKPGPERGDLSLPEQALPQRIGDWEFAQFRAAGDPEALPLGQYWWVHQWIYRQEGKTAVVSFDQLGEDQWHELTYCYRNQGWTILQRNVYEDPNEGGQYIVAHLRGQDGDVAVLVFSVFFEDGTWASPPAVDLASLNVKPSQTTFGLRVRERLNPIVTFADSGSGHDRALQCQVLMLSGSGNIESSARAAVDLHLESRRAFRRLWMEHASAGSVAQGEGHSGTFHAGTQLLFSNQ